jgi:hypothetical protein
MILLSRNSTDEEILEKVYTWLALLDAEDYVGETKAILYGKTDPWGADYLRKAITEYRQDGIASNERPARITSIKTAKILDHKPDYNIIRYLRNDTGLFGAIDNFDLPINGYWSKLTADFVILNRQDPTDDCVLCLEEIHSENYESYRFWFG